MVQVFAFVKFARFHRGWRLVQLVLDAFFKKYAKDYAEGQVRAEVLTPRAEEQILENRGDCETGSWVVDCTDPHSQIYSVRKEYHDATHAYRVNLGETDFSCSCMQWSQTDTPCQHTHAVFGALQTTGEDTTSKYTGNIHKTDTWRSFLDCKSK